MKKVIPTLFLILLFVATPVLTTTALAQETQYTCPMHPHYVADRPGTCPICGMDLMPMDSDEEDEEEAVIEEPSNSSGEKPKPDGKKSEKKILYWVAPMNPNYKMDKPGKSPMGMDLVPVYADAEEASTGTKSKKKSGRSSVKISPEMIQNIGVRSEVAQMASFGTLVRSYGDVTEDVRLQSDISGRVAGWIKDLQVKAEGDEVKKGDLLFKLDSPELISAQQDYVSALNTRATGRVKAAQRRLKSLGVQDLAIKDIKKSKKASMYVPFYAEQDGIVSQINIREGSYIKSGMKVIQIQDYSSVWIDVSIAEQDIPYINDETRVSVAFPNLGIQASPAKIDYIYPTIDRSTRTGRVRLVLDNSNSTIKPGAYADVEFETGVKRRLSIPSDAILKSKDGDFVVVAKKKGRFQPKKVLTGLRYKGRTEILKGIKEDDEIVVSGQFLIDSESALRESFRKMKRMQKPLDELDVDDDQMAMINHLVDAAIYISDELNAKRAPNPKMIMPAITLGDHLIPVFRGTQLQFVLEDAEESLINGKDSLTDKQWQDTLSNLVVALKPWILEGKPEHYKAKNLNIYMDHGLNKYWIQIGDKAQNPYGKGMAMKVEAEVAGDTHAK